MAVQHQVGVDAIRVLDASTIADVRARHRGPVTIAGDPGYEEARKVRNGLIDRHPAAVFHCTGAADVIEAVNFARDHRLTLSIRAGAHNVSGAGTNDGGAVIDLSGMRGVRVDPATRTVRAEGGATWGEVDREAQVFGLATPGGVVSTTGVAGLTLHGGLGWLRRKHGLSLDTLQSVDIVTADGVLRTASEQENPDLFWAVRGAGSNFGVVTSFEFRAAPVGPMVALAAPFYPISEARRLLPLWRDFAANAPDELSSEAMCWSVPAADPFPAELHGQPVFIMPSVWCGDAAEGEAFMRPLRELGEPMLDLSGIMPYTALQSAFDPLFPHGGLYYWKSLWLDRLDDEAMDAIVGLAIERPDPKALMAIWQLGGEMARVPADATSFGRRTAPWMMGFDTTWSDPADTERCIAWTREAWKTMQRFNEGGLYLNFAGFGEEKEDLVKSGYGANYARLSALKAAWDPGNLFHMNQNVIPRA